MLSKEVVSISTGIQYASDKFNYLRCKISITDKKIQSSCKRQTELNISKNLFLSYMKFSYKLKKSKGYKNNYKYKWCKKNL